MTPQLAEAVFVDGHADGGVHADFFEGVDFTAGLDSAGGDDGMLCSGAKIVEPFEIRAGHGAFAVNVGAEKGVAEGFELQHDIFRTESETAAPAVNSDAAFCGVEGNDDFMGRYLFRELHAENAG